MTKLEQTRESKSVLEGYLSKCTGTIYTVWHKTTNDGMSRYISVYVMVEGHIINLTWHIAKVLGYRLSLDRQLIMPGCGYDVGYHIADRLRQVFNVPNFSHTWI